MTFTVEAVLAKIDPKQDKSRSSHRDSIITINLVRDAQDDVPVDDDDDSVQDGDDNVQNTEITTLGYMELLTLLSDKQMKEYEDNLLLIIFMDNNLLLIIFMDNLLLLQRHHLAISHIQR